MNSKDEDVTIENITDETDVRIENALKQIKEQLRQDGKAINKEEEKNIRASVKKDIDKNDEVYSKEQVDKFCKNYEKQQEQKQNIEQVKEESELEEKTLSGDALKRRYKK